jgi:hypothetical protein
MHTLKLIRHLLKLDTSKAPAAKTVALAIGTTEGVVKELTTSICNDGIYTISVWKGGGLSLTGGLDKEKDIYPHVEKNAEAWVKSSIFGHHGVTHQLINPTYKKKLSGKWSTPDLTLLCVHKFLHAPQNRIDIATIEVKHASIQFDVACVYEALAHTRVSSYSVLFFFDDPKNNIADRNQQVVLDEIKMECARLGIGLVISEYPCDINTWQYLIPAKKHEPDTRRIDSFIEDAFDHKDKNWLKKTL